MKDARLVTKSLGRLSHGKNRAGGLEERRVCERLSNPHGLQGRVYLGSKLPLARHVLSTDGVQRLC